MTVDSMSREGENWFRYLENGLSMELIDSDFVMANIDSPVSTVYPLWKVTTLCQLNCQLTVKEVGW